MQGTFTIEHAHLPICDEFTLDVPGGAYMSVHSLQHNEAVYTSISRYRAKRRVIVGRVHNALFLGRGLVG